VKGLIVHSFEDS